jgi:DNA-binding response OmpR family regulator
MPASSLFACKHLVTRGRTGVSAVSLWTTVPPMSHERSDAQPGGQASPQRAQARLRVAVIDRDPGFLQVLANRLGALGCEHRALSSPATVETLVAMRLNALVLDLTVVGPDSWEYLERVCGRLPGLAVVVCTGPSSVAQRVRGLRLGADAWMTKPCHPEELICVIEAAVRRHRRQELPQVDVAATIGEITIRPDLYQGYVGDQSLELTAREFEILQLLAQSDRVLRREEIYERVWGYAMAHGDRSVDVFVRKLRQKLRATSPSWSYIHTHFGVGYRFAPELEGDEIEVSRGALEPAPALPAALTR